MARYALLPSRCRPTPRDCQPNLPSPYRMTLTQKTKTALASVHNNVYLQCRGPLLSELNRSRARLQPLPSPDWGMGNQNRAKRAAPATPRKKQLKPRMMRARGEQSWDSRSATPAICQRLQRANVQTVTLLSASLRPATRFLQHQAVIRRTRQQENHSRAATGTLFNLLPRRSLVKFAGLQ